MSSGPHIALAVTSLNPRQRAQAAEAFVFHASAWAGATGSTLAAPPKLEDETFSAVLNDSSCAFDRLVDLTERLWPLPLRAALVSVGHHAGDAAMQRARHKALETLEQAGKEGARFRVSMASREDQESRLAESSILLHAVITEGWTSTRHQAVRAYRELGRQKDVAEKLEVTQQAVSQMLRGARLRELREVENHLRAWFAEHSKPGLWPLKNLSLENPATAGV